MALMLDEEMDENVTTIKVVGVGGGGGNAVNRMVADGVQGVEFIAFNTDQQALSKNHATIKVQLGAKLTKGRGAGADPEVGQRAAEESKDEIANVLKGAQMVFITAGMGGGTGTGAAPVVAEVAHDLGILTVGIVTKPFAFEGKRKMGLAEQGIANLLMHVDSLIVIPNERLKMISQEKITLMNAFQAADNVLRQGVESISALINVPAFINLDFADVRSIMKDAGYAHMGTGSAKGAGKARARPRTPPRRPSPAPCSRPASRAPTASSSTLHPAPTSAWRTSRRRPASSPRAPTPTPTSSGAPPLTRTSRTRCGSRWWPPALRTAPATPCARPLTAPARPAARRPAPALPPVRPARSSTRTAPPPVRPSLPRPWRRRTATTATTTSCWPS